VTHVNVVPDTPDGLGSMQPPSKETVLRVSNPETKLAPQLPQVTAEVEVIKISLSCEFFMLL